MAHKHPANVARHDERTFGQRVADSVARNLGSWRFILIQTGVIAAWMILNGAHILTFDLFPWLLLNICLSLQAAYAAPMLQLSSNRQSEHDRLRAEHAYDTGERDFQINMEALERLRAQDETTLKAHGEQLAALTEALSGVRELISDLHGQVSSPSNGGAS